MGDVSIPKNLKKALEKRKEPPVEKPCLFDNSKECPARIAYEKRYNRDPDLDDIVEKVCPLCPLRLRMISGT